MMFYVPMEPVLINKLIEDESYIHQIKWDGIRAICYITDKESTLKTKNNNDVTSKYPELCSIITKNFKSKSAVLDGEIVSLDEDGKPSFHSIMKRHMLKSCSKINYYAEKSPAYYILFDIIFLDGKDLRQLPYCERKSLLEKTYENDIHSAVTEDFSDSVSLFQLMKEKKMEGIVSKNLNSPYVSGKKHSYWFKTKIRKKMFAVIGGIKLNNRIPASLLLGVYNDKDLYFIGNASSGLKQTDLYALKDHLDCLKSEKSPFIDLSVASDVVWLKPKLTCLVGYFERTENGHLRHPEVLGFSQIDPFDICGEEMIDDYIKI